MFTLKNSKFPIGIDISDSSLKAVQLDRHGEKLTIQAISRIDLPHGIIVSGEIKDAKAAGEHLSKMLLKPFYGVFTSKEVISCLPASKTYLKLITVENSPNNFEDLVIDEIQNHIPIPVGDMIFDWQEINTDHDKVTVLIGASPRNSVYQYLDLFSEQRLSLKAFETASIATARALLEEEKTKTIQKSPNNYALINIDSLEAGLTIYAGNTIVVAVSAPISSKTVTGEISKALDITEEQAEKAKIICGFDENKAKGIIKDILNDDIKKLNEKITETFDFFEYHYPQYGPVNKIMLCGEGARIKNVDKIIEEKHKIETSIPSLSSNIKNIAKITSEIFIADLNLPKNISNPEPKGGNIVIDPCLPYTTAIGLSLRNIYLN